MAGDVRPNRRIHLPLSYPRCAAAEACSPQDACEGRAEELEIPNQKKEGGRISALPPSLVPAGISREQAAEYVGLGTTKFDELVRDGRMPKPKLVDSRKVWVVDRLKAALLALPEEGEAPVVNPWDSIL